MKAFLFKSSLFVVFCLAFYIVIIVIYGTFVPQPLAINFINFNNYTFTKAKLKEAEKVKNIDVLIIGSSHAYRGYDTRIFNHAGLSAFNLGSDGQTPLSTEFLVKRYVKGLNPKFVIIDVYPVLLGNDGMESQLELMSYGLI